MKINYFVLLLLAMILLPVGSDTYAARSLSSPVGTCPSGTGVQGNVCVLDSDLVLTQTIELGSDMTLNCRGHRILPMISGSGTTPATYVPSVPAAAIVISGDSDVDLRNCIIGEDGNRFDFGVIAMNSKDVGKNSGHRIHDNQIHVRDTGVLFLRVDDARINDNVITWTHGHGIWLTRDCDRNRITGNTLSSPGLPAGTTRLGPNGSFDASLLDVGIAIATAHLQPVFNVVVGGRLYQFPNSEDGTYERQEDNIVERNQLNMPGTSAGKNHAAILAGNNHLNTRVIGNTVTQGAIGIFITGLSPTQSVPRAARCSGDPTRFCGSNGDCFIDGYDTAPVGTCPARVNDVRDLRSHFARAEYNVLTGPFNSTNANQRAALGIGQGVVSATVSHNVVNGSDTAAGISLFGASLETLTVTGNRVQGASNGLLLQQFTATTFGGRVYANDFIGSTSRAIGVIGAYTLPTELSWDGVGNFWDHAADPCFAMTDSPSLLITDSYASCVPFNSP